MKGHTKEWRAHRRRVAALRRQLRSAPTVVLSGVLEAYGVSGGFAQGDRTWWLSLHFAAWRADGGPVREVALNATRPATEQSIDATMKRLGDFEVVRVRARLADPSVEGDPQALLIGPIRTTRADRALNRVAARLRKPVTFRDRRLGTFTLDGSLSCFNGTALWGGRRVGITIDAPSHIPPPDALAGAARVWDRRSLWWRRVTESAVRNLLRARNTTWLIEGERPMRASEFKKQITLETVCFGSDGSVEFWCRDGDMFGGHAIVARGNLRSGIKTVDIEG